MKVKMLSPTYWDGKQHRAGDTADVAEDVATRWEKAGIAEKQASKPSKTTEKE